MTFSSGDIVYTIPRRMNEKPEQRILNEEHGVIGGCVRVGISVGDLGGHCSVVYVAGMRRNRLHQRFDLCLILAGTNKDRRCFPAHDFCDVEA